MILCLLSIKAGCLEDLAQPAKAKLFNMNISPTDRLNQRAGFSIRHHFWYDILKKK